MRSSRQSPHSVALGTLSSTRACRSLYLIHVTIRQQTELTLCCISFCFISSLCGLPSPAQHSRSDSEMYSFSFPWYPWQRRKRFASAAEILAYLHSVVKRFDLGPHMRFNAPLQTADFCTDRACWTVTLASGETLTARHLFSCAGYFEHSKGYTVSSCVNKMIVVKCSRCRNPDLKSRFSILLYNTYLTSSHLTHAVLHFLLPRRSHPSVE